MQLDDLLTEPLPKETVLQTLRADMVQSFRARLSPAEIESMTANLKKLLAGDNAHPQTSGSPREHFHSALSANVAREIRYAVAILLDATESPEASLQDVLTYMRSTCQNIYVLLPPEEIALTEEYWSLLLDAIDAYAMTHSEHFAAFAEQLAGEDRLNNPSPSHQLPTDYIYEYFADEWAARLQSCFTRAES